MADETLAQQLARTQAALEKLSSGTLLSVRELHRLQRTLTQQQDLLRQQQFNRAQEQQALSTALVRRVASVASGRAGPLALSGPGAAPVVQMKPPAIGTRPLQVQIQGVAAPAATQMLPAPSPRLGGLLSAPLASPERLLEDRRLQRPELLPAPLARPERLLEDRQRRHPELLPAPLARPERLLEVSRRPPRMGGYLPDPNVIDAEYTVRRPATPPIPLPPPAPRFGGYLSGPKAAAPTPAPAPAAADFSSLFDVRGVKDLVGGLDQPEYRDFAATMKQRLSAMLDIRERMAQARATADKEMLAALEGSFTLQMRELGAAQKAAQMEAQQGRPVPLSETPFTPMQAAAPATAGQTLPPPTFDPAAMGAALAAPMAQLIPPPAAPAAPVAPAPVAPQPALPTRPLSAFAQALGLVTKGLGALGGAAVVGTTLLGKGTVKVLTDTIKGDWPVEGVIGGAFKRMFSGTLSGAAKGFAAGGVIGGAAGAAVGLGSDMIDLGGAASPQAGATFGQSMELLKTRVGTALAADAYLNLLSQKVQDVSGLAGEAGRGGSRGFLSSVFAHSQEGIAGKVPLPGIAIMMGLTKHLAHGAAEPARPEMEAPPIIPGVGAAMGAQMSYEGYARSLGMSSLNASPLVQQQMLEQLQNMVGSLKEIRDNSEALKNVTPAWR